jgi:DNA-binding MarR family transcriptional regulator
MDEKNTKYPAVLPLDQYWPYLVTVLADRIARRTGRLVKERGLNLSQWRVLAAIAEVPGRTSAEVVTITPMDKGIVSRATKALLEMGFVRREASQSDGRLSHLHLTDAGATVYDELIPTVQEVTQWASERLSPEHQARLSTDLGALMEVIPDLR